MKQKAEYKILSEEVLKVYNEERISLTKLAKRYSLDRETVTKWIKNNRELKIKKNGAYNINSSVFENIDSEEKAYWLGFIYADGYISDDNSFELSLKISDSNHLEKFKKFLNYDGKITLDTKVGRCRLMFRNKKIGGDLKNLGCIPRKSLVLKFPTKFQVPEYLLNHFIRGYFDGDGSINGIKNSISISVLGTNDFLSKMLINFQLFSVLKVKNVKGSEKVFYFQISGSNARKFLYTIYKNSIVSLDRKYDLYIEHFKKYNKEKYVT